MSGTPIEAFERRVDRRVTDGLSRSEALQAVAREDPVLFERYIAAVRGGRTLQTRPDIEAPEGRRSLTTTYWSRPRCPKCGSVRLAVRKTIDQGDGSRLRYVRCAECNATARLVIE